MTHAQTNSVQAWRRALAVCSSPGTAVAAEQLDTTPRLAIICAFAPELQALLAQTKVERTVSANGVEFSLGTTGR